MNCELSETHAWLNIPGPGPGPVFRQRNLIYNYFTQIQQLPFSFLPNHLACNSKKTVRLKTLARHKTQLNPERSLTSVKHPGISKATPFVLNQT